ncbi:MAG: superoxide dismutase [Acidobacteria bacterium]|nr:MAG: superoxide dismutase [Acidobacteriota bacterium]
MQHRFMIAGAMVLVGAVVAALGQAQKPASSAATSSTGNIRGHADIKGDQVTGRAEFVEEQQGAGKVVQITLTVTGLKPGQHGVHLHAVGKCTPDFTAAGGHFDPGPAGNPDPDANHPFHMGDLPNLQVDAKGRGTMKAVTSRVTLSPGPLSLFDADGSAIIIHGNPDQMTTGEPKSGVSGGPRVACGVIEKR